MRINRLAHLIWLIALLFLVCMGLLIYSVPQRESFGWAGPISDKDWIDAEAYNFYVMGSDGMPTMRGIAFDKVRVGDDLFGYPAPLENFIKIHKRGSSGGDSAKSWIDEGASASYMLPLYSDKDFVDSFSVWRISSNTFRATPDPLYLDYIEAIEYLEKYHSCIDMPIDYKVIRFDTVIFAHLLYVSWEDNSVGKIFSYMLGGDYNSEKDFSSEFDLSFYLGRALTEEEIVQLFRELEKHQRDRRSWTYSLDRICRIWR